MARTRSHLQPKGIPPLPAPPVWAEVSAWALTHNLRAIRDFVNPADEKRRAPRKVLSIVKGNGYGHGAPQVAKIREKAGSDWFGVPCTAEGIDVRKAGVRKPILVLTSFWPGEEPALLKHDLTPVVHRCEQLAALERAASRRPARKPFSFHLKMDTGMNRLGILPSDVDCFARQLAKCKHLRLGGVMPYGYHPGYDPAERRNEAEQRLPLKPVMSLRTRIISLRRIPQGVGVGYGAKFIAERASTIAVLAAGYGDGIHRSLSNGRGSVLVRGKLAPIVGIISMDVTMIDVTEIAGAEIGDVVIIYGTDGEHVHPANAVARGIGTVTSDLLCAVAQRVPRIYVA